MRYKREFSCAICSNICLLLSSVSRQWFSQKNYCNWHYTIHVMCIYIYMYIYIYKYIYTYIYIFQYLYFCFAKSYHHSLSTMSATSTPPSHPLRASPSSTMASTRALIPINSPVRSMSNSLGAKKLIKLLNLGHEWRVGWRVGKEDPRNLGNHGGLGLILCICRSIWFYVYFYMYMKYWLTIALLHQLIHWLE